MMKKFFVFLLTLLLIQTDLIAGYVPGYMGKRLSVGGNVSTFFMFEDFSGISEMLLSTRFSYKSELALNYTVSRKVSVGGSFYYGSQKYLAGEYDYLTSSGRNYTATLKEDYLRCRLMIYEFNLKIYQRNFIAPIGPYHQFGIGMVKYNATAPGDSLEVVNADHNGVVIDVIDLDKDPFSCVKLSYHIGYAAPVFSNCYFNFALGVNFFRGGDSAKIRGDVTYNDYVLAMLNKHLRRHNFLEFKIGFGWLAF